MTARDDRHIQQHETRRVVDRAVGGQLVLLRSTRRSVLLVAVVLAHLHQSTVVDRELVDVSGVIDRPSQSGRVASRKRGRMGNGYVHFADVLLLVFRKVLSVSGEEEMYRLRSHQHVVILRVCHCLICEYVILPTSGIRTVHAEVLLRYVLLHIHSLNRGRWVSQARQIGTVELNCVLSKEYERDSCCSPATCSPGTTAPPPFAAEARERSHHPRILRSDTEREG